MQTGAKSGALRIAYLSDFSPLDRNLYSGGNARMFDALSARAGEVSPIDPGWGAAEPVRRAVLGLPEALSIRARWRAHIALSPVIGRHVSRLLAREKFDVLFCAYSFQSLLGLEIPERTVVAYTADALPSVIRRSSIGRRHGSYLAVSRLADPLIRIAEGRALARADLLFWPSDWLKAETAAIHGAAVERAAVVPWGANIPRPASAAEPAPLAPGAAVNLLFLGRDWIIKGGPLTLSILAELRARGIDARLTIVGCRPETAEGREGVTILGHLDKAVPEQRAAFDAALGAAHFLVMPTHESYGFAFCEASAHGLPALCWRVGGIPVRTGVNGHDLPPEAGAPDFADLVAGYVADPESYRALRSRTRAAYESDLNWEVWADRVIGRLEGAVAARRAAINARSPSARPGPFSAAPEDPFRTTG